MQRVQVPQRSGAGESGGELRLDGAGESGGELRLDGAGVAGKAGGISNVVRISPRKNHDPRRS